MTAEIRKEDLIDTSENKAIEDQESVQESKDEITIEPTQKQEPYRVPKKNIRELTNDEREFLVKEARQGINNEFYKVTFCKNGCTKITKKKPQKMSVSQKFIKDSGDKAPESKLSRLSNEQLLFEHVINLESQFATLKEKHKKLKKSYKQLHHDIYIDDEDIGTTPEPSQIQEESKPEPIYETIQEQPQSSSQSFTQSRIPKMRASGWRQKMINNLGYA